MYLSNENFTCLKEQIMHLKLTFKLLKNSLNPDINSIENSVDPDQLAS